MSLLEKIMSQCSLLYFTARIAPFLSICNDKSVVLIVRALVAVDGALAGSRQHRQDVHEQWIKI